MGDYAKNKGRSGKDGSFFAWPHTVMRHPNFTRVSAHGKQLLLLLASQYNGKNNGDLSATWKQAKAYGFGSKRTLARAKEEALHYHLISLTRQGGTNKPALYALTWLPIHECNGKLDVELTKNAPGDWMVNQPGFVPRSSRKKPALRVVKN